MNNKRLISGLLSTIMLLGITSINTTKANAYTESETLSSNYNLYYGQFHMHSGNSACGRGEVKEAYDYAKNEGNLDFMALTDHSNDFDNGDKGKITDGSVSKEWTEGHKVADECTTSDFVAMYAYEMTWANGNGHMNTYNTDVLRAEITITALQE